MQFPLFHNNYCFMTIPPSGPLCYQMGPVLGPFWDPFWGEIGALFGAILEPFWGVRLDLPLERKHKETKGFWSFPGARFGPFWEPFWGSNLAPFGAHFGLNFGSVFGALLKAWPPPLISSRNRLSLFHNNSCFNSIIGPSQIRKQRRPKIHGI